MNGEKAVHLEACGFTFKLKQQGHAVSSIGMMEDSPLCMFTPFPISHLEEVTFCSISNNIAIMKQENKISEHKCHNMVNYI